MHVSVQQIEPRIGLWETCLSPILKESHLSGLVPFMQLSADHVTGKTRKTNFCTHLQLFRIPMFQTRHQVSHLTPRRDPHNM